MTSQALRDALADRLKASGDLDDPDWERAARTVPREAFVSGGFLRALPATPSTLYAPVRPDDDGWLEGVYSDDTLITQLDGHLRAVDLIAPQGGDPTSSSTLPSLVLRMWQQLGVTSGQRVLEIGTGTGYSTALLCARLGEGFVTSVEYDKEVAARAETALARVGMYPTLVTGDGLIGFAQGAPYDRVIATCGVRGVPPTWIEQTRPGGEVLTTVGGWLGASELARLTVHDDGTASGPLLGGRVSFMLARPQLPPPLGLLPDLSAGEEREAVIGADVLDDWTSRFVVQSAVPGGQRLTVEREGRQEDVLIDVDSGSWAALYPDNGRWTVRQDGPGALWDVAEDRLACWNAAGAPELERFTLHVTSRGQTWSWSR